MEYPGSQTGCKKGNPYIQTRQNRHEHRRPEHDEGMLQAHNQKLGIQLILLSHSEKYTVRTPGGKGKKGEKINFYANPGDSLPFQRILSAQK
jgi:hypothetical protein